MHILQSLIDIQQLPLNPSGRILHIPIRRVFQKDFEQNDVLHRTFDTHLIAPHALGLDAFFCIKLADLTIRSVGKSILNRVPAVGGEDPHFWGFGVVFTEPQTLSGPINRIGLAVSQEVAAGIQGGVVFWASDLGVRGWVVSVMHGVEEGRGYPGRVDAFGSP